MVLIVSYIWMGYETNTEFIFYILSLFNQLTMSFGMQLPLNFSRTAQVVAAFIRIDKVLNGEELEKIPKETTENPSVLLRGVAYRLNDKKILHGVSVSIIEPGLSVITGPVGSGKSSLLKVILGEYHPLLDGN